VAVSLHEQSIGASDEWYTPAFVFEAMGVRFDLDVAAPVAKCPASAWCNNAYSHDSLTRIWPGFVWMNPPFGGRNGLVPWLEKFFAHGDGVALVPDRTSAPWFHRYACRADAVLFVGKPNPPRKSSNKIQFIRPSGEPGKSPAQGTALLALGARGAVALRNARRAGLGLLFEVAQ
jgi:hypothetical protein